MKNTIQQLIEDDANNHVNKREPILYIEGYLEGHDRGANYILKEHNQINKELLDALEKQYDDLLAFYSSNITMKEDQCKAIRSMLASILRATSKATIHTQIKGTA